MGLNDVASAERIHIGFFGMRNAGKSSLVNKVTGQTLSLVSDIKGTTTDPVKKAMELLPLGPVVILDTPGLDDEGELGLMRVERAKRMLHICDIAVLVIDSTVGESERDFALKEELKRRKIPFIIAYNKCEMLKKREPLSENEIYVSCETGEGIEELKVSLGRLKGQKSGGRVILSDIIRSGETIILVTPIDESAPKGRLILPQQLTLREILDTHATALVTQPEELPTLLNLLSEKPRLIITDSQVFGKVSKMVSEDIPLTSFSILMARYKGELDTLIDGFRALASLNDGDKILISEGCTHHRQCNDIGSVKMPRWIEDYTGKKLEFCFSSGAEFPDNLKEYKLIVHCGGCMLNEKEMAYRISLSSENEIPIVNYGIIIAGMTGSLERSIAPFIDKDFKENTFSLPVQTKVRVFL